MTDTFLAMLLAVCLAAACEGDTIVLPGGPPGGPDTGTSPGLDSNGGWDGTGDPPDHWAVGDTPSPGSDASVVPPDVAAPNDVAPPPDRGTTLPTCLPNDDGVVSPEEVVILTGATASYLSNAAGTLVAVDADGIDDPDAPGHTIWDFQAGPRELATPLTIESVPADAWYRDYFPADVTYVTPLGPQTPEVLGLFRVWDDRLEMLGLASRTDGPGHTLLVYDDPVALYRFPLRAPEPGAEPQRWGQTVTFRNAVLQGVVQAGQEEYRFTVDRVGRAILPHFTFTSVLRIRLDLTQTFVFGRDGNTRHSVQFFYFTECVGEVARIVGPGVTSGPPATVTEAQEFRRLGL